MKPAANHGLRNCRNWWAINCWFPVFAAARPLLTNVPILLLVISVEVMSLTWPSGLAHSQTTIPAGTELKNAKQSASNGIHIQFSDFKLGKMPILGNTATVKAGPIDFVFTNESARQQHTVFLAQIEDGAVGIRTTNSGQTVDMKATKLKYIAKLSVLRPRETVRLTFDLWRGRYVVFCSRKSHYSKEGDFRFEVIK